MNGATPITVSSTTRPRWSNGAYCAGLPPTLSCWFPRRLRFTHRRTIVRKIPIVLVILLASSAGSVQLSAQATAAAPASPAAAPPKSDSQHVLSKTDLDLLRQDIRSKKKQLIAQNLKLSDAEATKFWPVYDKYTAELIKINDKKFGIIHSYADQWRTMTDEQAVAFAKDWVNLDTQISQLREKYVPTVSQVLTGRNTATFFQLDRRISMLIDLQLSSQMPVVNPNQP